MADYIYHESTAHEASALPVMLPGKLVGRDQPTLAAVYGALKQNRPVLLYGDSGIGKSAVAATMASAYTQSPGGTLWFNLDEDTLGSLIVRVGRAYNDMDIANSDNPVGMVGAAASLLAQHKPLVVLDGNLLIPAVSEFLERVATNLPAIIISERDSSGNWESIEVPALSEKDAAMLVVEKSGIKTPEVADIANLLQRIPFALTIAAGSARLAKLDGAALLAALQAIDEDDPNTRALTLGFAKLQPALQGILLMLGATFTGSASSELLGMLSGAPIETVQKVMSILAASGFVEQTNRYSDPFYTLHPLTYAHAQAHLAGAGRLGSLQDKVKDVVLAYARKYSGFDETDHARLAAEMDNFLATAHWASERGNGDVASQIVVSFTQAGDFVTGRGYLYELLQLQETGTSRMSAFPANEVELPDFDSDEDEIFEDDDADLPEENLEPIPAPEDMIAPAKLDMHDADAIRAAIGDARANGDDARVLMLQEALAKLLRSQHKEDESLAIYNEILLAYEDADDRQKILETRTSLADLMVKQSSSRAAVLHATQGAKIAEELKDTAAHAKLLILLGDARQQLGESTDAILAYSQALDLAKDQDDRETEAEALMQLGFAQLDDDQTETAIVTWDGALKLCKELGKRDCEGRILGGLGTAFGELSRWEEAINYHNSALYIAREVRDQQEEALQLSNLGYASKQANKLGDAVLRYRQALHLAYANDERENIVSNIVDLARLLATSPMHLNIAEMLVDDALQREPSDREVTKLKEQITNEKMLASANNIEMKEVKGTAQEYSSAAYRLLDA